MSKRPRIKVPYEGIDVALELTSITLLLLMTIYTIMTFADLPETIPTHFNAQGVADDHGSKWTIWIIPGIAIVMYALLFIINRYPHLHNYMVNITEENALMNYRFSTRVLRIINVLTMLLFAYISYHIIEGAKSHDANLGKGLIPIIISSSILVPVFIILYYKKQKKMS